MSAGSTVVLKAISRRATEALAAGRAPDVAVAPGDPTEFSSGIGPNAGASPGLGPFFIHRVEDDVVMGEIGAAFIEQGTIAIGYAIVPSVSGRVHATDAVRALVALARRDAAIARIVAHTPVPPGVGSGRREGGVHTGGRGVDEHDGEALRVIRWELDVSDAP